MNEKIKLHSKLQPPDGWLNAQALADDIGTSRRHIDYWTECNYVTTVDDTLGSGYQRLYTPEEAAIAAWILNLRQAGVELPRAASLARNFPEEELAMLHAILTESPNRYRTNA